MPKRKAVKKVEVEVTKLPEVGISKKELMQKALESTTVKNGVDKLVNLEIKVDDLESKRLLSGFGFGVVLNSQPDYSQWKKEVFALVRIGLMSNGKNDSQARSIVSKFYAWNSLVPVMFEDRKNWVEFVDGFESVNSEFLGRMLKAVSVYQKEVKLQKNLKALNSLYVNLMESFKNGLKLADLIKKIETDGFKALDATVENIDKSVKVAKANAKRKATVARNNADKEFNERVDQKTEAIKNEVSVLRQNENKLKEVIANLRKENRSLKDKIKRMESAKTSTVLETVNSKIV